MTLNQLVCRAASTYPDAAILQYWSLDEEVPLRNRLGGDTLAQFIGFELYETFDRDASDGEQLATAVKVMQKASDELGAVAQSLSDLAVERLAA